MAQACLGLMMLCATGVIDAAPASESSEITAPEAPAAVEETCDLPLCGPLGHLAYCVEGYESRHDGAAVNRTSGARGWLQYLPGTARRWGVVIGNRQSEWLGFERIAAQGRAFLISQWVPLQRGLC